MRSLWIMGGVLAGRKAFGLAGAVLGAGLGYVLFELADILRRQETMERSAGAGETSAAARSAERYPEESIIDAMQQAEEEEASRGEEADFFREVSGEKKQLH